MCKEDIRIGRKTKRISTRFPTVNNIGLQITKNNADRIRVILAVEFNQNHNIPITGNIDPPTGNVNETFGVNFNDWIKIGPIESQTIVPVVVLTPYKSHYTLSVDMEGLVVTEELWALQVTGIGEFLSVTEVILEQQLEDV